VWHSLLKFSFRHIVDKRHDEPPRVTTLVSALKPDISLEKQISLIAWPLAEEIGGHRSSALCTGG
jgi:hypothetical protein